MKVTVTDDCIACNVCIENCPEVFEMGDAGIAVAKMPEVPAGLQDKVAQAAEDCPVDAIVTA